MTEERLGVYRPEEHIDNPKDYADNIDARQYDRRLRGPVDPRELQVDPRTGIKNYIANEQGGWATSTRYIRESLLKAIELGRRGKDNEADMHEALRLLGQVKLPNSCSFFPHSQLVTWPWYLTIVASYTRRPRGPLKLG